MSPPLELLTRNVKSYQGIRSSPMDTCSGLFDPLVTMVCNVADTSKAEMKTYGLVALAPLAITHESPLTDATSAIDGRGRGPKAITTANIQIGSREFHLKHLAERAE